MDAVTARMASNGSRTTETAMPAIDAILLRTEAPQGHGHGQEDHHDHAHDRGQTDRPGDRCALSTPECCDGRHGCGPTHRVPDRDTVTKERSRGNGSAVDRSDSRKPLPAGRDETQVRSWGLTRKRRREERVRLWRATGGETQVSGIMRLHR